MSTGGPPPPSTSSGSHTSQSQHAEVTMAPPSPPLAALEEHAAALQRAAEAASAALAAAQQASANAHINTSNSYTGPVRATADRMIIKLTTNLMNTYNDINEKYYANKRKRILEQQQAAAAAAAKKSVGANGAPIYNDGHDDKDYNYIVIPQELLADRYLAERSIGKGSFGRVVKAFDTKARVHVAIKIVKSKSAFFKQAQIELKILMSLQADADKWNIVTVVDQFIHKNHQCIVFELLSLNLYELLKNTRFTGVSLKLIAKFGQQLLCTLGYLGSKERGEKRIIHCDLKPENILLRNCFPAADHQILTDQGFLLHDQVAKRLAHAQIMRVACYDAKTQQLQYHAITRDDLIVQQGTHQLVEFADGIVATRGHDMYVRAAGAKRYMKRTAGELFDDATEFTMLGAAANGLEEAPSSELEQLGLSSAEHCQAFYELAGYCATKARLDARRRCIGIQAHSATAFVDSRLSTLFCAAEQTGASRTITDARWYGYFASQSAASLASVCASPSSPSLWPSLLRLNKSHSRCVVRGLQRASASPEGTLHASSPLLRDQLVQLLLHAGLTPTVESHLDSCSWILRYQEPQETTFTSKQLTARTYMGRVWCVTVPHADQLLIVRRASFHRVDGEDALVHATAPVIAGNCKKSAIKVIDFGSACFANQKTYTYIQSRFYRAPEVLLGLPYNGAIDMWSLGCILVEMHTGKPLFDGQDEADQMVKQVEILGVPPRHMLENNRKAEKFFEISESTGQYRLKRKYLHNTRMSFRKALVSKWEDTPLYLEFENLILSMLVYDPLKRIRPSQALAHPFFAAVAGIIAQEAAQQPNSVVGMAAGIAAPAYATGQGAPSVAAAAAGAQLSSASGNPLGTGSGVATALATGAAAPAGDAATAMDTSSPAAAAAAAANTQQQQQQAAHYHHHHHHHHGARSNSRKRPHSNPVFGAGSSVAFQHPLQPLDVAQLAQAQAKQQKQQQETTSATTAPLINNLMPASEQLQQQPESDAPQTQTSAAATVNSPSSHMEDAPDAASTTIAPTAASSAASAALTPATPVKHAMVTRSAVSSGAKPAPAPLSGGAAASAVASKDSSAVSSARTTPEPTDVNASHLMPPDASTTTTAAASAASSPKAALTTTSGGNGSTMVDIDPPVVGEPSTPVKSSGGKRRSGRKNKAAAAAAAAASSTPNMSESEDGPTSGVGSHQMSRMSLHRDNQPSAAADAIGHRTRSHTSNTNVNV